MKYNADERRGGGGEGGGSGGRGRRGVGQKKEEGV